MDRYIALRCPECGKRLAYVKITTGEGVCHTCGVVLSKEEIEKQKAQNKAKAGL